MNKNNIFKINIIIYNIKTGLKIRINRIKFSIYLRANIKPDYLDYNTKKTI